MRKLVAKISGSRQLNEPEGRAGADLDVQKAVKTYWTQTLNPKP